MTAGFAGIAAVLIIWDIMQSFGKSRDQQKLLKYFNGTATSAAVLLSTSEFSAYYEQVYLMRLCLKRDLGNVNDLKEICRPGRKQ